MYTGFPYQLADIFISSKPAHSCLWKHDCIASFLQINLVLLSITYIQNPQSFAEQGIVQEAIRKVRAAYPDLVIIADCCLCEYTDHGHCGLVSRHRIYGIDLIFSCYHKNRINQLLRVYTGFPYQLADIFILFM